MRRSVLAATSLSALCLLAGIAGGELQLPTLIADNMVLQRNAPVTIWGRATPGQKVTVTLDKQTPRSATADAQGRWAVQLAPMKAGGPFEMTVAAADDTRTIRNVLVGEVWVCSGQSNMAFSVRSAGNGAEAIAAADHPRIRLFTVFRRAALEPQERVGGRWDVCSPKTVGRFSAVGYFFGRDLHEALGVPVGLIHGAVGGTAAERWTSLPALAALPGYKRVIRQRAERLERKDELTAAYERKLAAWQKAAAAARAAGEKPPPRRPYRPNLSMGLADLYNGMIAPLVRYRIAGVIWYQGEANARHHRIARAYRRLFAALIGDWRGRWGYELPFLFVQLSSYQRRAAVPTDPAWAHLREAQRMTLSVPKTAMAVSVDVGDGGIHPRNKKDVGARLALAARAVVYGEDIVYRGPVYRSMKLEGGKVRLTFASVGGGLVARGGRLTGFAVAGSDKRFVWAEAKIDGDDVVVWSDEVPDPAAVRYAWAMNPACSLYNQEGLAASPFRTDDWPPLPRPGPPRPRPTPTSKPTR
jgi:sialate O-acetylesterase